MSLRYWVTPDWSHIRAEWTDDLGTHSADGNDAPEEIRTLARQCLADRYEHGVPGCTFVGFESRAEMLAERCEWCAAAGETNARGQCVRCETCDVCRQPINGFGPTDADSRIAPWDRDQCESCHSAAVRAARRESRPGSRRREMAW